MEWIIRYFFLIIKILTLGQINFSVVYILISDGSNEVEALPNLFHVADFLRGFKIPQHFPQLSASPPNINMQMASTFL